MSFPLFLWKLMFLDSVFLLERKFSFWGWLISPIKAKYLIYTFFSLNLFLSDGERSIVSLPFYPSLSTYTDTSIYIYIPVSLYLFFLQINTLTFCIASSLHITYTIWFDIYLLLHVASDDYISKSACCLPCFCEESFVSTSRK